MFKSTETSDFRQTVGKDVLSSVVVFLVALPLSLGIAIASGVPPALGIVTAIIGGIVAGALAGCPLQVSGPAAGLVTLVWEIVQTHGFERLSIVVLLAGILQIGAGWLQLGQWFRAVSPAVIQGMLAGIGVLIFASQFHVMVDDTPKSDGVENLLSLPGAVAKGLFPLDGTTHHLAAAIGMMSILIIIIWNFVPKRLKMIPGTLIAVAAAVAVSSVFNLHIKYVAIPHNLMDSLRFPSLGAMFPALSESEVWIHACTIAFIASAETLLTASALERMRAGIRTLYNKEMIAQGVGNALCGLVGAPPMTGVIVRSAANVDAGAQTRLSTMLHGLWLLVLVVFAPFVLAQIPIACLAAILVYTGYKLVNIKAIKSLLVYGKSEVAIYAATLVGIVTTNLLEGVILGFVLSLVKLVYVFARLDVRVLKDPEQPTVTLSLRGSATFVSLPRLASILEAIPSGREVHVQFQKLDYIDHACLELLMNWEKQYSDAGGSLVIEWKELRAKFHDRRGSKRKELNPVL